MIEATTQNCPHCHGTGLIRSEENLALAIIRQIEDESRVAVLEKLWLTAQFQLQISY